MHHRQAARREIRGPIILLEAGKNDEGDAAAVDLSRLDDQTDDYDWGFMAATLAGAKPELYYARARILGGCANHNDCAFLRPPDSDFTEWESRGAKGWGPAGMAPYFNRVMENTGVEESPPPPRQPGLCQCRQGTWAFGTLIFRGRIAEGVGYFPLNAKGSLRQSSSVTYLHPLSKLPRHLEIWTETQATKILVENGKAVGAETTRGTIRAGRAVILACGSIQTPQLMMLSGLGPAQHLRELEFRSWQTCRMWADISGTMWRAPIVWQTREAIAPWDICPLEATMMLKLDADAPAPDVLFHFGLRVRDKYGEDPRLAVNGPAVKATPNVTRARSEGHVRLASADYRVAPVIELNYFSDPYDMRILLKAMRFTQAADGNGAFQQLCKAEVHPGSDVQSDDEWIGYIKSVCETVYHPCGTASIGRVVTP